MPGEFIDTHILIYSLDKDGQKQHKALALLADKPMMSVNTCIALVAWFVQTRILKPDKTQKEARHDNGRTRQ